MAASQEVSAERGMNPVTLEPLTWRTGCVVGHPEGDIWVVASADHFDKPHGGLSANAAAVILMKQPLPSGGLVSEYLFLEELERAALAAEITAMQAQSEYLRCSVARFVLSAAHAQVELAQCRYVSDTMTSLDALRKAQGGPALSSGEALLAMQRMIGQPADGDKAATLIIPWEAL